MIWLALCSQYSRGAGLARGMPFCPGIWEGWEWGSGGEGTSVCYASRDCLNAHTVSLLSSSPPHAATVAAAFSSKASLSHSWIFAVASEFVCFLPCPGLLSQVLGLGGPGISLYPLSAPTPCLFLCEAHLVISASLLEECWGFCPWLWQILMSPWNTYFLAAVAVGPGCLMGGEAIDPVHELTIRRLLLNL